MQGTVIGMEDHTVMTEHTQYNLPPMADESCTTGNTSKPTSVTADTYLQYHTTKQSHTRTDLLDDILRHINNNQVAYSNAHMSTINNQWTQYNQQAIDGQQGRTVDSKQQNSIMINADHKQDTIKAEKEIRIIPQASKVVKTR